jgi:hypothetical protein
MALALGRELLHLIALDQEITRLRVVAAVVVVVVVVVVVQAVVQVVVVRVPVI